MHVLEVGAGLSHTCTCRYNYRNNGHVWLTFKHQSNCQLDDQVGRSTHVLSCQCNRSTANNQWSILPFPTPSVLTRIGSPKGTFQRIKNVSAHFSYSVAEVCAQCGNIFTLFFSRSGSALVAFQLSRKTQAKPCLGQCLFPAEDSVSYMQL